MGALLLLGGCTVADGPPVAGSRPLTELTGREYLQVCDWARDYMGGEDYENPESDEDNHTGVHYCPPTEEELAFPDNERVYFRWSDEFCDSFITVLTSAPECPSTVDDFTRVIHKLADGPCLSFSVDTTGPCTFNWYGRDDEGFE